MLCGPVLGSARCAADAPAAAMKAAATSQRIRETPVSIDLMLRLLSTQRIATGTLSSGVTTCAVVVEAPRITEPRIPRTVFLSTPPWKGPASGWDSPQKKLCQPRDHACPLPYGRGSVTA